jgi:hypothetical protein
MVLNYYRKSTKHPLISKHRFGSKVQIKLIVKSFQRVETSEDQAARLL